MTVQRSAVEALSQMAAIVGRCVESTIASVLNKLDSFSIKEPAIALKAFVDKKDVFAILRTRLSKGLIYQLSPSHQKKMGHSEDPEDIFVPSVGHSHGGTDQGSDKTSNHCLAAWSQQ